uniref:Uncharacterized protein n=1 Tax=Bionectria ochroleuca TaxID=29856 RepID=A0A0B7KLV5_BIOOC
MVGLLSHARHNWAPKAQILNELDDLLLVSLRPPEVRIPKNLPRFRTWIQAIMPESACEGGCKDGILPQGGGICPFCGTKETIR